MTYPTSAAPETVNLYDYTNRVLDECWPRERPDKALLRNEIPLDLWIDQHTDTVCQWLLTLIQSVASAPLNGVMRLSGSRQGDETILRVEHPGDNPPCTQHFDWLRLNTIAERTGAKLQLAFEEPGLNVISFRIPSAA
ncbi:hypothetical protein JMG10_33120 [Nostoc ellipsosporum NOK]|nr:hypothetical protein [Nostoc ellipsosporum NOK]